MVVGVGVVVAKRLEILEAPLAKLAAVTMDIEPKIHNNPLFFFIIPPPGKITTPLLHCNCPYHAWAELMRRECEFNASTTLIEQLLLSFIVPSRAETVL